MHANWLTRESFFCSLFNGFRFILILLNVFLFLLNVCSNAQFNFFVFLDPLIQFILKDQLISFFIQSVNILVVFCSHVSFPFLIYRSILYHFDLKTFYSSLYILWYVLFYTDFPCSPEAFILFCSHPYI